MILVNPVNGKMRPDELRDAALIVAEKRQEIVEEDAPASFFARPKHPRTKEFLRQVYDIH